MELTLRGPNWIKPKLFESLMSDLNSNFKSIKQFRTTPALAPGENYASLMIRIEIQVELLDGNTNNVSFMMKTKLENGVIGEVNYFEIESDMYSNILKDFEKLYAAAGVSVKLMPNYYKLKTDHDHILLEDLKLQGFKNADRIEGLDKSHIEFALKKIAQLHAASAVRYEQKGTYEKKYLLKNHMGIYGIIYNAMQPTFMKVLQGLEDQRDFYQKVEATKTRLIDKLISESEVDINEFNVLNHGDFWTNNIMYKYDKSGNLVDIVLIDFQTPVYGSPVRDVICLILSSGKAEIKIKHFDYFLRIYHMHLINYLKILNYKKMMPTLRDLHISCLKNGAYAFITSIFAMPATVLDASEQSNFENFVSNTEAGEAFRQRMLTNKRYLAHTKSVFPWLLNRGALDF